MTAGSAWGGWQSEMYMLALIISLLCSLYYSKVLFYSKSIEVVNDSQGENEMRLHFHCFYCKC